MTEPRNHMYLRSEIRDQVTALALVMARCQRCGHVPPDYAAGYMDALVAVLTTFGVELPPPLQRGEVRP